MKYVVERVPESRPHTAVARLEVLGAAVLFSTGGAAIKGTALGAWQVAGLRSLIAAAALLLVLPDARRHWGSRNLAVAFVYAATLVLFVTANKLTTAADAIYLQSTGPLYVLLLSPWLLHERARRSDLAFLAAMALGLALVIAGGQQPLATAPRPAVGNLFAATSGFTWALTVIGLRWMGTRGPEAMLNTVVLGNLCAAAVCLPLALPIRASAHDWLTLLWLGVFQIGLAYVLLSRGVRGVTALDASLLLLAEPVLNPVWAWAVHGEQPAAPALAGGALILASAAARTVAASG
jgi:drug/metabolite transporter (DMT)-like permease